MKKNHIIAAVGLFLYTMSGSSKSLAGLNLKMNDSIILVDNLDTKHYIENIIYLEDDDSIPSISVPQNIPMTELKEIKKCPCSKESSCHESKSNCYCGKNNCANALETKNDHSAQEDTFEHEVK